jgi:hypothetical protein
MSFMGRGQPAAVALAISLTLGLAACGSDGGDASTAASPAAPQVVSPAQFIDRSHALCKKWKVKINRGLNNLYRRRAKETGEAIGQVGAIEAMRVVIVPSMRLEIADFEAVGLPRGEAYEAEAVWQAVRNIVEKIEAEGIVAWTRESLLDAYRPLAKQFQLQNCLYF